MRIRRRLFVVLTNQQREHRRQQHEDQRLYETHQQFHELERNLDQPAKTRNGAHRFAHRLAGENISV